MGIYLRDGRYDSDIGIVNLHPFQDIHWVLFSHECCFDSFGCATPQKLSKFITK